MPQIDLLLSNSDREAVLHSALRRGAVIVPDRLYVAQSYDLIAREEDVKQLAADRQFWIFCPDWISEDLLLKPVVHKELGPRFYIAQRYGGPALRYVLYPERTDVSPPALGSGSVDYYPHYYSSRSDSRLMPPEHMIKFFKQTRDEIKSNSACIKADRDAVWVNRQTLEDVENGSKMLPGRWKQVVSDRH